MARVRTIPLFWAALAALLIWGSGSAWAQKGTKSDARVLIVIQESVEGKRSGSKGAEPELAKHFLDKGFQVVERFESGGVASRVPLERILNDEVAGNEISAINADVLVVGRVEMSKEKLPYGLKGKAFEASMEIRVLLTDNGRVIYSKTATLTRPGSSAKVSAELARTMGSELLPKVQKALTSREVIEVRISGLTAAKHADKVAKSLASDPRISSAKVRFVSSDVTIIDLRAKGVASSALESVMTAAGLQVSRRSANVITASYDAVKASQRSIIVATFENRTKNSAHDWIGTVGPEIFETEIDNSRYLNAKLLKKRAAASKSKALKSARSAKADLVVLAFFQPVGSKLRLSAQIVQADGKVVAKAQVIGDDAEAVEAISKLVWKLDQMLYKKLNPTGSLKGYETKVRKYAPKGSVLTASGGLAVGGVSAKPKQARLVISDATMQPIFPAQLAHYANRPFGEVVLSNAGKSEAVAVRLGIKVEGLIKGEHLLQVDDIPAGGEIRVPLTAVFDRTELIGTTQRRPVRVDLRVQYLLSDGEVANDSITSSTVLHDRNAMNWQEGRAIAAFVTYRDPFVEEYARSVLTAAGKSKAKLPPALTNAVALWDTIPASGMRYRRDPVAAFGAQAVDAVYFPRDTLQRSVGDCDDLAVLYSALIAASGGNARIVYTPGHVFVAVDTELDVAQASVLGGASRTLEIDGRAWLPIEITKLKGGFLAAWDEGIAEIARYRDQQDKITYVDFRSDWLSYPPFPLNPAKGDPPLPGKGLAKQVEKDIQALVSKNYGVAKKSLPTVQNNQAQAIAKALQESPWRLLRNGTESALLGEYTDAVSFFSEAAKVSETKAAAYNNLGNTYTLLERYNQAIGYYEQALDGKASKQLKGRVTTNLGFVQYQAGKGKAAEKTLRKAKTKEARRLLVKLGFQKPKSRATPKSQAGATPKTGQSSFVHGMRAGHVDPSQVLIWIETR